MTTRPRLQSTVADLMNGVREMKSICDDLRVLVEHNGGTVTQGITILLEHADAYPGHFNMWFVVGRDAGDRVATAPHMAALHKRMYDYMSRLENMTERAAPAGEILGLYEEYVHDMLGTINLPPASPTTDTRQ